MRRVDELRVKACSTGAIMAPVLRIATLPTQRGKTAQVLMDASGDDDLNQPSIQLLEGAEYRFEWEGVPLQFVAIETDPQEIFQPDSVDGRQGRLRPGLSTGQVQVVLRSGTLVIGELELEVRSRKLDYLSEYQWMLRDIANQVTELVMERFAASGTSFVQDEAKDAVTLYQRFAFLKALIGSESFQLALGEVFRKPHVFWEEQHSFVRPGQNLKAESYVMRQLLKPGLREPWLNGPLESIPVRLERRHTEATYDTTPNKFVKFALERWRQVIADIEYGLAEASQTASIVRGRREVAIVLGQLELYLNQDLLKGLGTISRFPSDNQVLLRREGYRDIFRAYLEFELASRLSWRGAESSYSAGQRDVATLYEYWAYLQLAQIVGNLVGKTFDLLPLVEKASDGFNVVLQSGKETVLSGEVTRLGRRIAIELCYNKTFPRGLGRFDSWTRPMRPDIAIVFRTPEDEKAKFEPVVLAFDAKYRVERVAELFGQDDELADVDGVSGSTDVLGRGGALRADLLKMHAYRDAIRRSAGAYVLFPGGDEQESGTRYSEYQELLPGLGAFVLRPSVNGNAVGSTTLRSFLDEVLDHLATRLTRHERGRYWLHESYANYDVRVLAPESTETIDVGSQTTVLLGFVKSIAHWNWIQQRKVYNVRVEGRAGGVGGDASLLLSQLLVLYCPDSGITSIARIVSDPELVDASAMAVTGYPDPKSNYWCVQIGWLSKQECVSRLNAHAIDTFVRRVSGIRGVPMAVRWEDVVTECSN